MRVGDKRAGQRGRLLRRTHRRPQGTDSDPAHRPPARCRRRSRPAAGRRPRAAAAATKRSALDRVDHQHDPAGSAVGDPARDARQRAAVDARVGDEQVVDTPFVGEVQASAGVKASTPGAARGIASTRRSTSTQRTDFDATRTGSPPACATSGGRRWRATRPGRRRRTGRPGRRPRTRDAGRQPRTVTPVTRCGAPRPGPARARQVLVGEDAGGVEPVAHRLEPVPARVARREHVGAGASCLLPQCGRPSRSSITSSTARKYAGQSAPAYWCTATYAVARPCAVDSSASSSAATRTSIGNVTGSRRRSIRASTAAHRLGHRGPRAAPTPTR